jgi:hypothetical protein
LFFIFTFTLKSCEIFPPNYNVYRNDRRTLGGGVFILVEKSISSVEQTSFITDGEIEWVKVKMKNFARLYSIFGGVYSWFDDSVAQIISGLR